MKCIENTSVSKNSKTYRCKIKYVQIIIRLNSRDKIVEQDNGSTDNGISTVAGKSCVVNENQFSAEERISESSSGNYEEKMLMFWVFSIRNHEIGKFEDQHV